MEIYNIQLAYFFSKNSKISVFGLASSLYSEFRDEFNTEPQQLFVPEGAPENIPRCIWSSINKNLLFDRARLNFSFRIVSETQWQKMLNSFNDKLISAFEKNNIKIDRVGLVAENTVTDDLQDFLKQYIKIDQYNNATESNLAWLESDGDLYNIWTYLSINKNQNENRVMFDINSFPDKELSSMKIPCQDAMKKCVGILERRIENAFVL